MKNLFNTNTQLEKGLTTKQIDSVIAYNKWQSNLESLDTSSWENKRKSQFFDPRNISHVEESSEAKWNLLNSVNLEVE